jgi:hypothetical protein
MAPAILVLVGLMASRGAGWEPYSVPVGVEARGAHIEARATYDPGDKIGLGGGWQTDLGAGLSADPAWVTLTRVWWAAPGWRKAQTVVCGGYQHTTAHVRARLGTCGAGVVGSYDAGRGRVGLRIEESVGWSDGWSYAGYVGVTVRVK